MSHLESRFGSFGDGLNVTARQVHDLRQTYHRLRNLFGRTRWYSSATWVMWSLILVHLEMVLVSVQDRCTVCAKRTIGSEIVLGTPDGIDR
jgi:hypothetical protein